MLANYLSIGKSGLASTYIHLCWKREITFGTNHYLLFEKVIKTKHLFCYFIHVI